MSTSPSEDRFLKTLSTLKTMLASPSKSTATSSTQRRSSSKDDSLLIADLQFKLKEAIETAAREKSMRTSLEAAFEELTTHRKAVSTELEQFIKKNGELEDQVAALQQDLQTKEDEKRKMEEEHVQKANELHQEKESVLQQRDDMEARFLAAERKIAELQSQLEADRKLSMREKEGHQQSLQSAENVSESLRQALQDSKEKEKQLLSQVCQREEL